MYFALWSLTAYCFFSFAGAQSALSEELETGMLNFGQSLLAKLSEQAQPEENLLVSPLSVYGALALLQLGAADLTEDELSQALGFKGGDDQLTAFNQEMVNKFQKIQVQGGGESKTLVAIADGIFVANDFQVKSEYRDQVLGRAGTSVIENVDFAGDAQGATNAINQFISDQTKGRIPTLFPKPLDSSTLIVLATSLYFKSPWKRPFPSSGIQQKKFTTGAGDIDVAFLTDIRTMPHIKNDALKYEAVSLPYENQKFNHYVILPAQDSDIRTLIQALNADEFRNLVQETDKNSVRVALEMPKLKYAYTKSLNEVLKALGVKSVFEKANLSKMLDGDLTVSEVTHATTIELNENGTEAAAVTAVQALGASASEPIPFVVNRAFLFVIYDTEEKVVLFSGVVNKPNA